MNLVIVESPSKAKTINKFLGKKYKVKASMGHVIDLPKSQMGIDLDSFEVKYITIRGKGKVLQELKKEAKKADKVFLATDPDREGEAISWHLANALKVPDNSCRVVFNEITKKAVKDAFKNPKDINKDVVDAQQARRVLDRIVGYKISPILWDKVKRGLSAGRVQSVAVRLIVDREREIQSFEPKEYWSLEAELLTDDKKVILGKLSKYKNKKIEIDNKEQVDNIIKSLKPDDFVISKIKRSERKRNPSPPFTTSSLQQEAARKMNFTAKKTMMVAQQLYEGVKLGRKGTVGLITYIRTDSTKLSEGFVENLRNTIEDKYGEKYLPAKPRRYNNKKGAQEAHEAIRPTDLENIPLDIKDYLSKDQYKLYRLIWNRTMASQMESAVHDVLTIDIENGDYIFRQTGSELKFAGFMEVYIEGKDIEEKEEKMFIGNVKEKDTLTLKEYYPKQHFTQPPPRFSEAMLVKLLEEKGIGRPSTYAPIIDTIQRRGYILKDKKTFTPSELGYVVNDLMVEHFPKIVDTSFTAKMEEDLDQIEEGQKPWDKLVKNFYFDFKEELDKAEENIQDIQIKDVESDVECEKCGRMMVYKLGKFGKFLACPGFPECRNTKAINKELDINCPKCGKAKVVERKTKKGRNFFGCATYPDCDFQSWDKPTKEKCDICGSFMVEKGRKKKIVCSNSECKNEKK
ncbi:type I DNA topoisomerase [Proteinivorax hydrogeniformans]|uniref:DNA topoisomerase 1 n=1 Tax=Proteinivorax hydrogeniformans TaxID=1826727 RepID=A0AAU8HQX3_9FIRM